MGVLISPLHECISRFIHCINDIKLRKGSYVPYVSYVCSVSYVLWFKWSEEYFAQKFSFKLKVKYTKQ